MVQHALRYFAYDLVRPLYDYLLGNFTRLSMDKYSSNLIEFAIEKADTALQQSIVTEFIDYAALHKVVQS